MEKKTVKILKFLDNILDLKELFSSLGNAKSG